MMVDLTKRSYVDRGYIPVALRKAAQAQECQTCGAVYGTWVQTPNGRHTICREALDHVFPRRWLLNFGLEPNVNVNLLSVCQATCHAQKLKAENALFEANAVLYVQELCRLNWPKNKIREASIHYGLTEIVGLLDRIGKTG